MKLMFDIGGNKLLLSVESATKLTEALADAEWIESKYVGKEISPTSYINLLGTPVLHDVVKFGAMDDDAYGALQLTTKLFREKYPDK